MDARAEAQDRVGPFDAPDRYRITELKSRGGEGELWVGTVDVGGQELPVAVKVLHPGPGTSIESLSEKLRGQAELLRSLEHPNLVKVREAFEGPAVHAEGTADPSTRELYLVMNYVPGDNLVTWVERHPDRDVLEVTRIITRLAAAVDYLHRGEHTGGTAVLHRDVKPANVIVGADGAVRLVDFGFARFADADAATLVGTPVYLAPEVVAGASPSEAADRFGLGAVAYFLFTGEAPNPADVAGMRSRLMAVRGVEDREGFADHILMMLARDPARRPVDVLAWAQGLAVGAVSQRFPTTPMTNGGKPTGRRGRVVAIAGAVVLLLAGGGAAIAWLNGQDDDPGAGSADPASAAGDDDGAAAADAPDTTDDAGDDGGAGDTGAADGQAGAPAEVPDVTGQPIDEARAQLADLGFDVEVEREASAEAADTVLSQVPSAGSTEADTVTLVVAEEPGTVPDVTGEQLADALGELESIGMTVETVDTLDEELPDGQVVEQEPAAGQPFAEEATLTVARQPVITFLADEDYVEGDISSGSADVSGQSHTRSLMYTVYSNPERVGYDLGRHYRRFRATVGLRDDSPSESSAKVEVYGDGRLLFDDTLALGDSVPVDLDVTGVLRLELMATTSDEYDEPTVVWGDAQVLGTADEVPAPDDDE